ncbi:MAG: cell division protein SepF [Mycobacteriaceae bacterium]
MSSLHKLKAYFGMVPVEEYDEYSPDYTDHPEDADHSGEYSRAPDADHSRYADPRTAEWAEQDVAPLRSRGARPDRQPVGAGVGRGADRHLESASSRLEPLPGAGRRSGGGAGVRGALALDETRETSRRASNPFPEAGHPLATITTLHPRTYNEARTIGERYREGNPVIMNLTEMSDADAKRLVDFAAGLAFAMHGAIDKVTNKVFLLSPSDVDVSAEDRRRLAETGFFQ